MSTIEHIVDASIRDLATALASGTLTSVDLVAKYLLRISAYDCRNSSLNAIPLINDNIFTEASAADDRRIRGQPLGDLDGIPFTVKDSYKVKGMTVASGSEAFETLTANEDAFTVGVLRQAGAVLIGKTNMCPMAYGGMLRGLYGRAESPYNLEYLAAAFGSGSSNGSGVSVASSLAAFGMGEETVSSGRSPASNNALVAYTPSRGLLSIRGNWPLYPTCDVVVPHTRTMDDLFMLLDVITKEDSQTTGDFWRDQPFLKLPTPWSNPLKPFDSCKDNSYLQGKKVVVPKMYVEQCDDGPFVHQDVGSLWSRAKADLENAGATVTVVDEFPVMQAYDKKLPAVTDPNICTPSLPDNWNSVERGVLIANAWEDFLHNNQDPSFPTLTEIDPSKIFPQLPRSDPQVKFTEPANAVHWSQLANYVTNRSPPNHAGKSQIYDVPQLKEALHALEDMRTHYFDRWMDTHHFDFVAFPAAGDVARADADVNDTSAKHSWNDGVKYSHGNRALRHLGIPSVTVTMGMLDSSRMPMGLTFLGRAYDDVSIMKAAYAFEQKTQRRSSPPLTPPLPSDAIDQQKKLSRPRPTLSIETCTATAGQNEMTCVLINGTVGISDTTNTTTEHSDLFLDIYIDGKHVSETDYRIADSSQSINGGPAARFTCESWTKSPPPQDSRNQVRGKIARDSTMVMILARDGEQGWPTGYLKLIHASAQ